MLAGRPPPFIAESTLFATCVFPHQEGERWKNIVGLHCLHPAVTHITETVQHTQGLQEFQASHDSMTNGGGGHGHPSLTKKLSPLSSFLQRKKLVCSNGVSLGILTTLQRWPYTQQYMLNTKQTRWYFCSHFMSYCPVWALFIVFDPVFCKVSVLYVSF